MWKIEEDIQETRRYPEKQTRRKTLYKVTELGKDGPNGDMCLTSIICTYCLSTSIGTIGYLLVLNNIIQYYLSTLITGKNLCVYIP